MIDYVSNNYEEIKKTISAATLGNYSDDFYHYLIIELEGVKEIEDKESFIFIFAKNHYFWKNSKWNRQKLKESLVDESSFDKETEENCQYENLQTDQLINRYLHTYESEQDETHKKIIQLFLSSSNQNDLYKRHKIDPKTLKKSIEYVSRNFNNNRNVSSNTSFSGVVK